MARIKKAQIGNVLKAAGKAVAKQSNNSVKKVASYKPSRGKYINQFAEFSDNLMGKKPSSSNIKRQIAFDYKGNKPKYKKGGSFPDLNKDGKITKADILKGRGVIAKKGSNVKRAKDGKVQSMGNATKVGEGKYKSEDGNYKMKFKGGSEGSAPTKIVQRRTIKGLLSGAPKAAGKLNMKNGGKKAPKKMMGGGKCRYGC